MTATIEPTPEEELTPEVPTPEEQTTTPVGVVRALTAFAIDLAPAQAVSSGRRIGPNRWQIADSGHATISVAWVVRDSDGVEVETDNCQILLKVDGPQDLPAYRSASCEQRHRSGFNSDNTIQAISIPGTYTVVVTDEISGATGSTTVIVDP